MGLHGLWKNVNPVNEDSKTLTEIASYLKRHHTVNEGRDIPCFGVDLRSYIDEYVPSSTPVEIRNQEILSVLFNKLTGYLSVPATFVFVFDGPNQSQIKSARQFHHHVGWIVGAKRFIQSFGFLVHDAPGMATAELAMLNRERAIDAVITNDSHVFMFGATYVLRAVKPLICTHYPSSAPFQAGNMETFELYTEICLQHEHLRVDSQGELLLYALINGGDYSGGGLDCSPATSFALMRRGFGSRLISAIDIFGLDTNDTQEYLQAWRTSLCTELLTHAEVLHVSPHQASIISRRVVQSNFPDTHIIKLYLRPSISTSHTISKKNARWYFVREPSLISIARVTVDDLKWADNELRTLHLKRVLLPAVVMRLLYLPIMVYNPSNKKLLGPTIQVTIQGSPTDHPLDSKLCCLSVSIANICIIMGLHRYTDNDVIIVNLEREWLPVGL